MLSEDLKGRKFILTCYQVTSVLCDFGLRRDIMLLRVQVTKDEIPWRVDDSSCYQSFSIKPQSSVYFQILVQESSI